MARYYVKTILLLMLLASCAPTTVGELQQNGKSHSWSLSGKYTDIGSCLIKWLETNDPGHTDLTTGIGFGLQYREYTGQRYVEIHQRPNNSQYLYVLTLEYITDNKTRAHLLSEPYGYDWRHKALKPGLKQCSSRISKSM